MIFGGVSSRFWMMRKHFSNLSASELKNKNTPLHAWQCITLQLKHREVDLVIADQNDMDIFLRLIIHSLNTVNGNKNSAQSIIDLLYKKKLAEDKKKLK